MEHSKLPWKSHYTGYQYTQIVGDFLIANIPTHLRCETGEFGPDRSTGEENKANAAFIVKACNAYDGLVEVANLAIGMIVSINKPVTAKRDGPIRIPEKQALLLDKARAILKEAGEL